MKSTLYILCLAFLVSCGDSSADSESDQETTEDSTERVDDATKDEVIEIAETSKITCPKCGFVKEEELPTDVCLLKYDCTNCPEVMMPDKGDCCVFCTYGDDKCPSMQE